MLFLTAEEFLSLVEELAVEVVSGETSARVQAEDDICPLGKADRKVWKQAISQVTAQALEQPKTGKDKE
ncbi:MAG: hypothetical protein ACREOC_01440 [Gemmatimonadales bacterium]